MFSSSFFSVSSFSFSIVPIVFSSLLLLLCSKLGSPLFVLFFSVMFPVAIPQIIAPISAPINTNST